MRRLLYLIAGVALAACATQQQQPQQVERHDENSAPNLSEAARINAQLGLNYMRRGELKLAEEKLKRAVAEDPKLVLAHTGLGILYSRRGSDEDADKAFREALRLESDNPDSLNNYASFLCAKGKIDKAEELYLKAAQNHDYAHPEMAWTNASVCVRPSAPDKSEKYLREALKKNPEFPDALEQFALLSYQKADYLRARAFLQRYEAVAAPSPQSLWLRSKTESALGDPTTARLYEQRLKTQFPEAEFSETLPKFH